MPKTKHKPPKRPPTAAKFAVVINPGTLFQQVDVEGRIYVTGWYREMADDEHDTAWHKMETEGDVITNWQELPAAPSAGSQGGDV